MMNNIPAKTKEKWNKYFEALDTENTGTIKMSTLIEKLDDFECNADKKEKLKKQLEKQKDITLDYTDFLTKIIDVKSAFKEEDIINTFNHFDTDSSGAICINDISKHMNRRGEACSYTEATELLKGVDKDRKLSTIPESLKDEFCYKELKERDEEDDKFEINKSTLAESEQQKTAGHDLNPIKNDKVDEDGNRIQMTLNTFKKYICSNDLATSPITMSKNTPYDQSLYNKLRYSAQSINSGEENRSLQ